MTYTEFVMNIATIYREVSKEESILLNYVYLLNNSDVNEEEVMHYFVQKGKDNDNGIDFFHETGNSLSIILERCDSSKFKSFIQGDILNKFKNSLEKILKVLDKYEKNKEESNKSDVKNEDIEDTFRSSVDKKVREMQIKFEVFDKKFEKFEQDLNTSYTSLLINNVSILGIFVAIAFTGISSIKLFSKITVNFYMHFATSLFSLILVSFLTYNLLLMLFYFIYKINKINSKDKDNENSRFVRFFEPFMKIDRLLLWITLFLGFIAFICDTI